MLLKHEWNYDLGMDAADRSWQHYITEALSRRGRAEFAARTAASYGQRRVFHMWFPAAQRLG